LLRIFLSAFLAWFWRYTKGMTLQEIYQAIMADPENIAATKAGQLPLYTASKKAKIVLVGQAPGRIAQATEKPWNDQSGIKLRSWLGVSDKQFYDPDIFSILPMDFYYPGKGAHGDLPPRRGFAEKWHPQILAHMPDVQLIVLVGAYSQKYYLGKTRKATLTETVRSYHEYLPKFMPLVHPSPLNFRWHARNPWFAEELVRELQKIVAKILK